MSNLEIFHARSVTNFTPAPPPPPPPQEVETRQAHIIEAYVPASSQPRPSSYQALETPDSGPHAYQAVDLTNPQPRSRGTQPLNLPEDWMDALPKPAVDLSQPKAPTTKPATDLSQPAAPAVKAVSTPAPTQPNTSTSTPAASTTSASNPLGAVMNLVTGLLGSLVSNPTATGISGSTVDAIKNSLLSTSGNGTSVVGTALAAIESLRKTDSSLDNLINNDTGVRQALLAGVALASQSVTTGPVATEDGVFKGMDTYAQYEIPRDVIIKKLDDLAPPPPGVGYFDALHDATMSYVDQNGNHLSAEQTKALWDYYGAATTNATPEQAEEVAKELYSLLQHDRLTAQDSFGKTTFEYFEDFTTSPKAAQLSGTSKGEYARNILQAMARPDLIYQGDGTLDCSLATLEAGLAITRPADFARMMVQLGTQGQAQIPGKTGGPQPDVLKLPAQDSDRAAGRNAVDYAIQSSLAHYVGEDGSQGLTAREVDTLEAAVTGSDYATLDKNQAIAYTLKLMGDPTFEERFNSVLSKYGDTLKVTMQSGDVLHSMAVVQMRVDGISMWDPANDKVYKIPIDTFLHDLVRITAPTSWLDSSVQTLDSTAREGGGRTATTARQG